MRLYRAALCSFCVLFSIIIRLPPPAFAAQSACEAQLAGGLPPRIENAKLTIQTTVLCFSEMAILYSGVARTPIWSAEKLTAQRIERASTLPRLRANAFHEEDALPSPDRAELSDYRRSGYDRGHMAPNGDMSSVEAQRDSFSLANMIPQDPCNNEVLWEGIESAVRGLALSEGEVYVVTGPVFLGAEIKSLGGRVLIPSHIFKAIYMPSRNAAAVYFAPNDASQSFDTISLHELQSRVGMDVFPAVDAAAKQTAMALPDPTPHYTCRIQTSQAQQGTSVAPQ